jgi:hypothetical protein
MLHVSMTTPIMFNFLYAHVLDFQPIFLKLIKVYIYIYIYSSHILCNTKTKKIQGHNINYVKINVQYYLNFMSSHKIYVFS